MGWWGWGIARIQLIWLHQYVLNDSFSSRVMLVKNNGKEPDSWLKPTWKFHIVDDKDDNWNGILPDRLFFFNTNCCSFVNDPNSVGIVPVILFSTWGCKEMIWVIVRSFLLLLPFSGTTFRDFFVLTKWQNFQFHKHPKFCGECPHHRIVRFTLKN